MNLGFRLIICSCVLCSLCVSCNESGERLREGDFLFQDLNCGELCDAIEAVTEGINGKDFSHCGMVITINDTLMVVEAIGDGVQLNSLSTFLARSGDTEALANTTVARLKSEFNPLIKKAKSFALDKIGQPYDSEFLLDNGKWYCSELLYEAFKVANGNEDFFELAPMTYKDPNSGQFFPAWVSYYEALNTVIPEGKPGLNPGSISRSEKIEVINIDKIK